MEREFLEDEGKEGLSLGELWAALRRRRWWVLVPVFVFGWMSFIVARYWPYLYSSEALVLVVQQKVPEQYVTPNVVSDLQDRLQSMQQQILSRTRLQSLIQQFNLYPRARARQTMEDVVDQMRKDIHVVPVVATSKAGELTAFSISYEAQDPRVAQQITNELTSLFIEESLQSRTEASVGTTSFLENQLEQAGKDLQVQEQRQQDYKMRYLGELPEQEQSNLEILSSLEAQLNSATDSVDRAEQQKVYLQSLRNEYRMMQGSLDGAAPSNAHLSPLANAELTIAQLKKQLADLQATYTPEYPDIVRTKKQISEWEAVKHQIESEPPAGAKADDTTVAEKANAPEAKEKAAGAASTADPALVEVNSRLKAVDLEIRDRQKEINSLRERIRVVQSHLAQTPVREQQLAEVMRSYQNAQEYYQSLLKRKMQSQLATNLEERQQGEQFRVLDPASLPEKPEPPTTGVILAVGWILGLVVGIGLVALQEFRDQTVRSERDLEVAHLKVWVRIPVLPTPSEETHQKWLRRLETAGVALLVFISAGAGIFALVIHGH